MVYISERDFFGFNKTLYHIDRTVRENGMVIDNGYHEIYVNTEVEDGTTISEYMNILKSSSVPNNSKFPEISRVIKYYKEGKGIDDMCDIVEAYAKEKAEEKAKEVAKEVSKETAKRFKLNGVSAQIIHDSTGLSYEEIADL